MVAEIKGYLAFSRYRVLIRNEGDSKKLSSKDDRG